MFIENEKSPDPIKGIIDNKVLEFIERAKKMGVEQVKEEMASLDFLSESHVSKISSFQDLSNVTEVNPSDLPSYIETAIKLYQTNGIFSDIIDTFTNLTNSGLAISRTPNEESNKKYLALVKYINYQSTTMVRGIKYLSWSLINDYWLCGNSYPYISSFDTKKDCVIHTAGKSEIVQCKIPSVVNLNPNKVSAEETTSGNVVNRKYTFSDYPDVNFKVGENFYHIAKKKSYSMYGMPIFVKLAQAIYSLLLTSVLENSSLEGMINHFILVKIPDNLQEVSNTIASEIRAALRANLIVGVNEGVSVDFLGSKGHIEDMTPRIEKAKKYIYDSAGISEAIITGNTDIDADVLFPHLLKVILETELTQSFFVPFYEDLIAKFAIENNIEEIPRVTLIKTPLRLMLFNKHYLQLYDRGLLPKSMAVIEAGYDIDQILYTFQEDFNNNVGRFGFGEPVTLSYYGNNATPDMTKDPDSPVGIRTNENPIKDKKPAKNVR